MFLNIAYINKVNMAALNGTEKEGNILSMKKISDIKGNEFIYVSGQSNRRSLKGTLNQLGENISAVDKDGNPTFKVNGKFIDLNNKNSNNQDMLELIFKEVCDLDLFGYMFPNGGRRWSPIKFTPSISLYSYKGEYDYMTRTKKSENNEDRKSDIINIETNTMNFMKNNILINLKEIGSTINEFTREITPILSEEEKKLRINTLLTAIKNINGGANQARLSEDISPKFIVIVKQKTGNPFLLNPLEIDENANINIETIKKELKEHEDIIEDYVIGITENIFNNENKIIKQLKAVSMKEAFDKFKIN